MRALRVFGCAHQEARISAFFADFQFGNAQFARQDVRDARHIETALAAAGAQPGAALDAVIRKRRNQRMNFSADLAFSHILAAAYHAPVAVVLCDHLLALSMRQVAELRPRRPDGIPVLLDPQVFTRVFEQVYNALGDGRGG